MARLCARCGKREIEIIDDWESAQCRQCNDRDIERNENRREWEYFHDEPCPEIEINKTR